MPLWQPGLTKNGSVIWVVLKTNKEYQLSAMDGHFRLRRVGSPEIVGDYDTNVASWTNVKVEHAVDNLDVNCVVEVEQGRDLMAPSINGEIFETKWTKYVNDQN